MDLERQRVVNIASEQGRIIKETLATNIVYSGMNMYLPYAVESKSGSTVRWVNNSPVPHNVVGVYVTESEERKIDSGFFSLLIRPQHTVHQILQPICFADNNAGVFF